MSCSTASNAEHGSPLQTSVNPVGGKTSTSVRSPAVVVQAESVSDPESLRKCESEKTTRSRRTWASGQWSATATPSPCRCSANRRIWRWSYRSLSQDHLIRTYHDQSRPITTNPAPSQSPSRYPVVTMCIVFLKEMFDLGSLRLLPLSLDFP